MGLGRFGISPLLHRGIEAVRCCLCPLSYVVVTQLVRVPACQVGGRGFKSLLQLNTSLKGRTVQYVRLITFTIAGSTPASAIKTFGVL